MSDPVEWTSAARQVVDHMIEEEGKGYRVTMGTTTQILGQWHFARKTPNGIDFHMILWAQKDVLVPDPPKLGQSQTNEPPNPDEERQVIFDDLLIEWLKVLAGKGPGYADIWKGVKFRFEQLIGREESPGSDNASSIEL
ncbi:hypothetical protein EG329_003360 [Mollisiaceae sp. DMI_Dod_QoI]|nr:hypothetical protein EG329_003360 [Helotiales sp. DMI_Dod_QoI]